MSHSSVGRRAISRLRGSHLAVQLGELTETLQIFPWTTIVEIKQQLSAIFKVPTSSQKVFFGSTELTNPRTLNDYHIFDLEQPMRELTIELSPPGAYMRPSAPSPFLDKVLPRVEAAFKFGVAPQLAADGIGGTYILSDISRQPLAIFKPMDEEPFAPHNPRGYPGELGSPALRPGVRSGESAFREVAAYLIDHQSFSSVPETALVESSHNAYVTAESKTGSLQAFVNSLGCAEDFAPRMFSTEQVHKIAVLDIRILNMDRNVANLLVNEDMGLTPIDHGLAIPECLEIDEEDLCWMSWPQAKEPFSRAVLDYIGSIDVLGDIALLKNLPLSRKSLENMRLSGLLLQRGAAIGLNLYQIGSMLYRRGNERSEVELLVEKAKELYCSIQTSLPMGIHRQRSSGPLEDKIDSKIDICKVTSGADGVVSEIIRESTDQCFSIASQNERKPDEKLFQIIGAFIDHAISDKLRKSPPEGSLDLHCRSK